MVLAATAFLGGLSFLTSSVFLSAIASSRLVTVARLFFNPLFSAVLLPAMFGKDIRGVAVAVVVVVTTPVSP